MRLHLLDALTDSVYAMVDVHAINETLTETMSHMRGGTVESESAAPSPSDGRHGQCGAIRNQSDVG